LATKLAARSNAYQAFADDCLIIGVQGASTRCEKVHAKFYRWCEENGQLDALRSCRNSRALGRQLRKQVRGLENLRTFRETSVAKREWVGIRLKTEVDLDLEDGVEIIEPPKIEAEPAVAWTVKSGLRRI